MNELNEWIRFLIQYQIVGCIIIGYWRFSRGKYYSYSSDECSTSINCSYRRSNYCEKFNYYLCWECLWDSRHRNVSRWTNFRAIRASVSPNNDSFRATGEKRISKKCVFSGKNLYAGVFSDLLLQEDTGFLLSSSTQLLHDGAFSSPPSKSLKRVALLRLFPLWKLKFSLWC